VGAGSFSVEIDVVLTISTFPPADETIDSVYVAMLP
jgi:hypothetical protein